MNHPLGMFSFSEISEWLVIHIHDTESWKLIEGKTDPFIFIYSITVKDSNPVGILQLKHLRSMFDRIEIS